jgi:hypothetical protein
MDALSLIFVFIVSLVGLDLASVAWATDSRDAMGDDRAI